MYSIVSLLSGIHPFLSMHSLLVTIINQLLTIYQGVHVSAIQIKTMPVSAKITKMVKYRIWRRGTFVLANRMCLPFGCTGPALVDYRMCIGDIVSGCCFNLNGLLTLPFFCALLLPTTCCINFQCRYITDFFSLFQTKVKVEFLTGKRVHELLGKRFRDHS